ncbi:MAG TPA: hypothetical protein VMZ90_11825 [Vicinamibacterales bacterium]|nr:hypothetical protein [Vicinamibacterales bacterium]
MVKFTPRPELDLWLDEFRDANSLPAPKRNRVLPGTIMVAGLAICATVVLSPIIPTEEGVRFMIVVAALAAACFGWGLDGLLRPYKLVPPLPKVRVMEEDEAGRLFDADYHRYSIPFAACLAILSFVTLWWRRDEFSIMFLMMVAAFVGVFPGVVIGSWMQKREQAVRNDRLRARRGAR